MEQNDLELDIKWMNDNERLDKTNQDLFREPMENINVFFIYINNNLIIEKIYCENHPLQNERNVNVLKKEYLLHIIQNKKTNNNVKYKFIDALLFNVNLETEHVQKFAKLNQFDSNNFLSSLNIVNDIVIQPSLFIFHDINAIYFLFKEHDKPITNPKSILKDLTGGSQHKVTKKVRINVDNHSSTKKHR